MTYAGEPSWEKSTKSPAANPERSRLDDALQESGSVILKQGEEHLEPSPEAFSGLSDGLQLRMRDLATRSREFLSSPVIADTFADHAERRMWRTKLSQTAEPETVAFFQRNRLRQNAISPIVNIAPTIKRMLDQEAPASFSAREFQTSLTEMTDTIGNAITFGDRYNHMSFEEKTAFVFALSQAMQNYLAVASKESPREQLAA